ncbi:MAG: CHASE2 domain-containing protein, partial [Prochlorotrichaceae cyanobacterium]
MNWTVPFWKAGESRWQRLMRLPKRLFTGSVILLGIGVGGAGATALLATIGLFQPLEWQGYRLLFTAREAVSFVRPTVSPSVWDDRLVVIAIDDRSLKTYGQFATWKRDRYAELLNILQADPPAAIGFAMLFPEETPEDAAFAQAMLFNGTIVLGIARDSQGQTLLPLPFLDFIAGLGHVQSFSDSDGITRSTWLYLPTDEGGVPSLSVTLADVYNQTLESFGAQAPAITIPPPQPTLKGNQVWINWPGPTRQLTQYSLAAVLNQEVDLSLLSHKIVLVGITATGLESNPLRTPFYDDAKGAGVYLYAATLDNLLNDRFLHRPHAFWVGVSLVLLGLVSAMGLQ